jgi:hypothetical protein
MVRDNSIDETWNWVTKNKFAKTVSRLKLLMQKLVASAISRKYSFVATGKDISIEEINTEIIKRNYSSALFNKEVFFIKAFEEETLKEKSCITFES